MFATPGLDTVTVTVPPIRVASNPGSRPLVVLDTSETIARAISACRDGT